MHDSKEIIYVIEQWVVCVRGPNFGIYIYIYKYIKEIPLAFHRYQKEYRERNHKRDISL